MCASLCVYMHACMQMCVYACAMYVIACVYEREEMSSLTA